MQSIKLSCLQSLGILERVHGVCLTSGDTVSVRLSYKRLASKWHPEKNSNSGEAIKKFRRVSKAYRLLKSDNSQDCSEMKLEEMLDLFQDTILPKPFGTANGYGSSDEGDDEDEDGYDEDSFLLSRNDCHRRLLTEEEVNKNAELLITEEEKERTRAEKRRAKKKRRREKKKLEKQLEQQQTKQEEKDIKSKNKGVSESSQNEKKSKKVDKKFFVQDSSEDETDFDPQSAFYTNIVNKKKRNAFVTEQPQQSKKKSREKSQQQSQSAKSEDEVEELEPVVLRSRQLAIRGNEMAQMGHYAAAIDLFTEAIKLDSRDFRFFGNRSYCFDRMGQFEKALKDAEKSIHISSNWAKGYFRKGRALAGLKLYPDAEQAFMQVVRLDKNCQDAVQELLWVRTHQLTEMGFTKQQAETALRKCGTVQQALDSLLAGVVAENSLNDVCASDEESISVSSNQLSRSRNSIDSKMDPKNPEGLTALWVGNVLPEVTEKRLLPMFSKFGEVTSVRCLPDRFCAFVNFKSKESAGRAMHCLQGIECGGQKLLIKFPDNPIVNGGSVTIRKTPNSTPTNRMSGVCVISLVQHSWSVVDSQLDRVTVCVKQLRGISNRVDFDFLGEETVKARLGKTVLYRSYIAKLGENSLMEQYVSTTVREKEQKSKQTVVQLPPPPLPASSDDLLQPWNAPKQTGPVNGNECYFWRTTGCQFGEKCHYKHLPGHKGIDLKPWHKVK